MNPDSVSSEIVWSWKIDMKVDVQNLKKIIETTIYYANTTSSIIIISLLNYNFVIIAAGELR